MVAFVNMAGLTYEDGFVGSLSAMKRFKYEKEQEVSLELKEALGLKVGAVVAPCSTRYWSIPCEGVVTKLRSSKDGSKVIATIKRTCYPATGDKFTTVHGQKGVVTIVEDERMPVLLGAPDGFRVEFVIGSTSLIKRSTPGQLKEAWESLEKAWFGAVRRTRFSSRFTLQGILAKREGVPMIG